MNKTTWQWMQDNAGLNSATLTITPAEKLGDIGYASDKEKDWWMPKRPRCKVGWTGERCDCAKCETYRAKAIETPQQEWFAEFERLSRELEDAAYVSGQNSAAVPFDFSYTVKYIRARDALYHHARRRID